jgi:hypothetical protein
LGRKKKSKSNPIIKEINEMRKEAESQFYGPFENGGSSESKPDNPLMTMTQIEKETVGAVEDKMTKLGYEVIIRFLYLAPTNVFLKANAGGVIGCYKQFNVQNLNGFRPNGKITSKIDYKIQLKKPREFVRKKKILAAYQQRSFVAQSSYIDYLKPLFFERLWILNKFFIKSKPFVLNVEELASIYHFPGLMVEAPTLQRIEAKKSQPPMSLPVG